MSSKKLLLILLVDMRLFPRLTVHSSSRWWLDATQFLSRSRKIFQRVERCWAWLLTVFARIMLSTPPRISTKTKLIQDSMCTTLTRSGGETRKKLWFRWVKMDARAFGWSWANLFRNSPRLTFSSWGSITILPTSTLEPLVLANSQSSSSSFTRKVRGASPWRISDKQATFELSSTGKRKTNCWNWWVKPKRNRKAVCSLSAISLRESTSSSLRLSQFPWGCLTWVKDSPPWQWPSKFIRMDSRTTWLNTFQ